MTKFPASGHNGTDGPVPALRSQKWRLREYFSYLEPQGGCSSHLRVSELQLEEIPANHEIQLVTPVTKITQKFVLLVINKHM